MLFKSLTASVLLFALTSFANAQDNNSQAGSGCVISPALGATGSNPAVGDVQHPSSGARCGDKAIDQNIDTSTTVPVDTTGAFKVQITNFGTGTNNPRTIQSAMVDPTGTGNSFSNCQIVVNGDANPESAGSQELTIQLPDNTKCTGGTSGKLCLVSFATAAGDGNCVVVSQAGATTQSSSTITGAGKAKTDATQDDQTDKKQAQSQKQTQNTGSGPSGQAKHSKRMIRKRKL